MPTQPISSDGDDAHKRETLKYTLRSLGRRLELLVNRPAARVDRLILKTTARNLAKS